MKLPDSATPAPGKLWLLPTMTRQEDTQGSCPRRDLAYFLPHQCSEMGRGGGGVRAMCAGCVFVCAGGKGIPWPSL